jgi:hypothetical protein
MTGPLRRQSLEDRIMNRPLHALVLLAASLLAPAASAQDALGGGNALDNNFGVGSGGVNQNARQENFRARNNIVTGNVAAGRGFRGSVGYVADYAFRGQLGSDDLFSFRADSAFSSIDYMNYMGTSQRFQMGQDLGIVEVRRSTDGLLFRDPGRTQLSSGVVIDTRQRAIVDREITRASTAGLFASKSDPELVGMVREKDGSVTLAHASPLTGIHLTPLANEGQIYGLTSYDEARVNTDTAFQRPMAQPGQPFATRFEDLSKIPGAFEPPEADKTREDATGEGLENRPPTQQNMIDPRPAVGPQSTGPNISSRISDRIAPDRNEDYNAILRRIAEQYAGQNNVRLDLDPALLRNVDERFAKLREQLNGVRPAEPRKTGGETPEDELDPLKDTRPKPEDEIPGVLPEPDLPKPPEGPRLPVVRPEKVDEEGNTEALTQKEIAELLSHGGRIDHLAGASTDDRFNELLSEAEKMLRNGEYFLAERRFNRALRFVPGHPLASAGMGHAQLGAGVYLASALTLRNLLRDHPELIDAKYQAALLPNDSRIDQAVSTLKQRVGSAKQVDDAGFLLAYIGHQRSDKELVKFGLEAMEKTAPDDPLLPALRAVWLEDRPTPEDKPQGDAETGDAAGDAAPDK